MSKGIKWDEIEDEIRRLKRCLQSVKNPGDFACGGSISLPLPALCVPGLDDLLGLPLPGQQARAVIGKCSQAPYGHGEKTLVDTAVRKTRQLNPDNFVILNLDWEERLSDLVSQVKVELHGMCLHCQCHLPIV